jgi:Concanavalin A-like lectin/glucanases superfamily
MGFDVAGYIYNGQMIATETYKAISQRGLKLNLDASSIDSYPGSGTTWYDLTPNGYTADLYTAPTYNSSNGGYFTFNGTNHSIRILNSSSQYNFGSSDCTYAFWFKTTTTSGNPFFLYNCCSLVGCSFNSSGYVNFSLRDDGCNAVTATTSIAYNDNVWHYYVGQRVGTNVYVYIDGIQRASASGTLGNINSSNGNILLANGASNACPAQTPNSEGLWAGSIGTFHIYNRALDAVEILQNYNAQKSRFGL